MDSLLGSSFSYPYALAPFGEDDSAYATFGFAPPSSADLSSVSYLVEAEDPCLDMDMDLETFSADSSVEMPPQQHQHQQQYHQYQHQVPQHHYSLSAIAAQQQRPSATTLRFTTTSHQAIHHPQQQQQQGEWWNDGTSVDVTAQLSAAHHHQRGLKRSAASTAEEIPNAKRIKTEPVSPSAAPVANNNNDLVAAYQQLLLMQLQQVQALFKPAQAMPPHSPTGTTSASSSAPSSPVMNQDPLTPPEMPQPPLVVHIAAPPQRERRVRPKVVPEKGGVQCQGFNRKKNIRCRNAALMEFMGPRPQYCAEHIHLDPSCLYTKCRSAFHSSPDDGKGCREVVLKEFGFCHKHFDQFLTPLGTTLDGLAQAQDCLQRVEDCLARLSVEAQSAKKVDPDLFQRKHKLIPKFVQMKASLTRHLSAFIVPQPPPLQQFYSAAPVPQLYN